MLLMRVHPMLSMLAFKRTRGPRKVVLAVLLVPGSSTNTLVIDNWHVVRNIGYVG